MGGAPRAERTTTGGTGEDGEAVSGRAAYRERAWRDAYRHLSAADQQGAIAAEDLDRLGAAAYLTGQQAASAGAWERAHHAFLDRGEAAPAARCAFWLGLSLVLRGEHARGGGWFARAQRVLDEAALDCVEHGYLRIPAGLQALGRGEPATAYQLFVAATQLASRFGDPDLTAFGRLGQGQALVAQGEITRGMAMWDETMVAITTGEVSPVVAGVVYCAVIIYCREVFDLRRAQEWTSALSRWCAAQPDLKPYRGQCLVHRSEIMQLHGEWADAMAEVRQACEHLSDPPGDPVLGMALYQQAELLRLRGELVRADQTYRRAGDCGHPVQPGMALLRLAQGRLEDAVAAIRRTVAEATGAVERSRVLAAYVEVALAAGDVAAARTAADDLAGIADAFDSAYLRAMVGYAHGSVLLAEGDAAAACGGLRRAWLAWHELEAPYEAARVRLRMAEACRRLGDHDTAEMELDAACRVFQQLGAAPALEQARRLATGAALMAAAGGLTPRELEILRLVATGATNQEIADTLVISDKTVARHVSNLFGKLGVSSRTAATSYAYQHELL